MGTACTAFERNLVLYYYGECAEADRRKLQAHFPHCTGCRLNLDELHQLLPQTVKTDAPSEAFWEGYSGVLRTRLAAAEARRSRWESFLSAFRPWPLPALATALALMLALTLTLKRDNRQVSPIPPEQREMMEVLPLAQNLEFFRTLEILDSMDLLEAMEGA